MADAALPNRVFSLGIAAAVLVAGFALATAVVRLTDTWQLLAVLGLGTALAVAAPRWLARHPAIGAALARERPFLAVGGLMCAALYPLLATDPYQVHMVTVGGLFALMAVGLNVNTGYAGLADFGYIAYYAIGAYTAALLNVRLGWDFWICLPAAGLAAALLSLVAAVPAVRVKGHYLALVTLGYSYIVIQLITNLGGLTGGTQGVAGIAPPSLFGHDFQQPLQAFGLSLPYQANFYYLVLLLLTLAVVACARLARSRWGRCWSAMRGDEVAARAAGLPLTRLKLMAFATGASLGGLAGAVYAPMVGFIDPSTFRHFDSIFLLAIVAIGNWRLGGVILAALLFTVLPEKLRSFDEWRLLIFGGVLLLVMLLRGRRMLATHV